MTMKAIGDIASHRLTQEQLACEFSDVAPLLDATAAAAAAVASSSGATSENSHASCSCV